MLRLSDQIIRGGEPLQVCVAATITPPFISNFDQKIINWIVSHDCSFGLDE